MRPARTWFRKFADARRGMIEATRGQSSFIVHLGATALVVLLGWWRNVSRIEWCLLMLCVTVVLMAEVFDSALEHLAKAITREQDDHIRAALDMASGAVLLASLGAAIVGTLLLLWL